MNKPKFLAIIISLFTFLSCTKDDPATPDFPLDPHHDLSGNEYEVYSSILDSYGIPQVIVRQETSTFTPPMENFELFFRLNRNANMDPHLFSRYEEQNLNSTFLDSKMQAPSTNFGLISNSEYGYYFGRENLYKGWQLFNNKYPESKSWFFTVNKIGFNEEKTQAMVGVESYWFNDNPELTTLNGGSLYYLEKTNGVWEIIGRTSYHL